LKVASEAFAVTEVTVNNGLSTQLELKDARLLYDQAQLGFYNACFDYLCAIIDWETASGETASAGFHGGDS
jgi:outer membrane protein TolC